MRVTVRTRPGRVAACGVAAAVLIALGMGLAPAPAYASESPTTASPSGGADAAKEPGSVPAETAPTLLVALAAAHTTSVGLGDTGGLALNTDTFAAAGEAIGAVVHFLSAGPDVDPGAVVDVDELLVRAEELRTALESLSPGTGEVVELYQATVAEAERIRALAAGLVTDLSAWAYRTITPVVGELPTSVELVAFARSIQVRVHDGGGVAPAALLGELARIAAYLTDERHQRTVKESVTALLLVLAHYVNPLPDTLAPTAEVAVNAAGELVGWADELVQQGVDGPGPFYGSEEPAGDEPTAEPTEDVRVIDSDVWVGDEPVGVSGPVYATRPAPAEDDVTPDVGAVVAETAEYDCGMFESEQCKPPVGLEGGWVIHKPIVRVVLVSSWWDGDSAAELKAGLHNLYSNMGGSGYQNVLRQYWDYTGYIGAAVDYQGMHVLKTSPPAIVSYGGVGGYAVRAAAERPGWKTNDSVVWVIALPPGSVAYYHDAETGLGSHDKCGYQSLHTSGDRKYVFAVLDYPRAQLPGNTGTCMPVKGDVRGSLTWVAAHEYVGAVTNPEPRTGWHDGLGQHLPELCRARITTGPGGEKVAMLWSNAHMRCVPSMTPRFGFQVTGVGLPPGDGDAVFRNIGGRPGYTRGHSYPGAVISVRNTGNMPWLLMGAPITYLATADNQCSRFAVTSGPGRWASCRRIMVPPIGSHSFPIKPGEEIAITFPLRPDGSLADGQTYSQEFSMVVGSVWIPNTGTTPARLSGIEINTFDAEAVGASTVGFVGVGQHGLDATVKVTLRNTGTATWYPREVMYIGPPPGVNSPYAASSWPRGPGGCRACRAHRFEALTPPGATYTFDLVVHLPANDKSLMGEAEFYPYADVKRVADGVTASHQLRRGLFKVRLVMLPKPVAAHEVTGYGFASGDAPSTAVDESGFSCLAVAGVDAVSTRVTACTARITTSSGTTSTYTASAVSADGPVAWTSGLWTGYTPAGGDTIEVCWNAESTFLDGTTGSHAGCST